LLRRGLKWHTIWGYLSSIRVAHIFRGFCMPAIREDIVVAVINGAKNRDLLDKHVSRLSDTPALMRELKDRLKEERSI
jgi:hypothetical protein